MIKYNLKCKNKHEFESWFSNSKEFEKLRSKKMIECIYCKSKTNYHIYIDLYSILCFIVCIRYYYIYCV